MGILAIINAIHNGEQEENVDGEINEYLYEYY